MTTDSDTFEPDRSQPVPDLTRDPQHDGFPAEEDVSAPPPGTDQADDEEE